MISVVVPTRNSASTLERCLDSVFHQTHHDLELIVVDTLSEDRTLEIAEAHGARIIQTKWRLLGARYIGHKASRGDPCLLLDSDQVLEPSTLERGLRLLDDRRGAMDILFLEETSFRTRTWIEQLFAADRRLIHRNFEIHSDPLTGPLLPRLFRKAILDRAFDAIPEELLAFVVAHDHAIIYFEASKHGLRMGLLPNAIRHIEPPTLAELARKNLQYGLSTRQLAKSGYYTSLLSNRAKPRIRLSPGENLSLWIQSTALMCLKGLPFAAGYAIG